MEESNRPKTIRTNSIDIHPTAGWKARSQELQEMNSILKARLDLHERERKDPAGCEQQLLIKVPTHTPTRLLLLCKLLLVSDSTLLLLLVYFDDSASSNHSSSKTKIMHTAEHAHTPTSTNLPPSLSYVCVYVCAYVCL